ncbi:hypothetical protein ACWDUC_35810, partial [Streptomyces tricolor]
KNHHNTPNNIYLLVTVVKTFDIPIWHDAPALRAGSHRPLRGLTPLLRKGVDAASLRDADGNSLREFPKYGSYAGRWGLRDFLHLTHRHFLFW